MVHGAWCMVHGVWCMVYGVRCMVHGVWCMVYGVRCMVYGVWCTVYGAWCTVYGVWCIVYGVWCTGMMYGIAVVDASSQHAPTVAPYLASFGTCTAMVALHNEVMRVKVGKRNYACRSALG
jgi:hypothetical protein